MDKAKKVLEDINSIEADEDPTIELFEKTIDDAQELCDNYVTPRVEISTFLDMGEDLEEIQPSTGKARRRRINENIPDEYRGIIQRAYDEFFVGNFPVAIALAKDALESNKKIPESYDILASVAIETGELDKALVFLGKAAKYSTDSFEIWVECAKISLELEKYNQAAHFLRNAINANKNDQSCLLELQTLLNTKIDNQRLQSFVLTELFRRNPHDADAARNLAQDKHQNGKITEAMDVLKEYIDIQIESHMPVSLENANLLSTLYLCESMNEKVIELDSLIDNAPCDFKLNAAIALIRESRYDEAKPCISEFLKLDPNVFTDAYDDLAKELIQHYYFSEAASVFQIMQDKGIEKREDIANVLIQANRISEAIETLKDIIIQYPNNISAISSLLFHCKANNLENEAIEWLDINAPSSSKSDDIILKRAISHFEENDIDSFIDISLMLICRILYDVFRLKLFCKESSKSIEKILGFLDPTKMSHFMMKVLRYKRFSESGVIPLEHKDFFNLSCNLLMQINERKMVEETMVLGGLLMINRTKLSKEHYYYVLYIFSLASFQMNHGGAACNVMRSVLLENQDNDLIWEIFNIFIQKTPDQEVYANKFMIRALSKIPDCAPLKILLGNHSQSTVWFDHALLQYLSVFREKPNEPIIPLLLCSSYLSKAYVRTQKHTRKSVLTAYACIRKYVDNRSDDFPIESDYNMARFFHAIKMMSHAEIFYRKVLESPVDYENIALDQGLHDQRYNLKRDAAYNLSLIFKESNPNEARRIMKKYLTV